MFIPNLSVVTPREVAVRGRNGPRCVAEVIKGRKIKLVCHAHQKRMYINEQ